MNPKHPLVAIRETLSSSTARNHETEYKREIVDLFRDYRHPWDIFTELVQNSVDAINQHSPAKDGEITLEITKAQRNIRILDNGIGIQAAHIKNILVPNVSVGKDSNKTYGYKGVGLSFVSHLTRLTTIKSRRDGKLCTYSITNNIDWVIDRKGNPVTDTFTEVDEIGAPYTEISITLDGAYSDSQIRALQGLDDLFDWATDPKLMSYLLRSRTAVGNTRPYFEGTAPTIKLKLIIDGIEHQIPAQFISPFDAEYSKSSRFVVTKRQDKNPAYQDIFLDANKPDALKSFKCLRHDVNGIEVGARVKTKFNLSILCCGETAVGKLEEEYSLAKNPSIFPSAQLGTGIYLAIGGMPTGIRLHHWTDGFNKRFFCIVDVFMEANSELDKGRKGISDRTRTLIINAVDQELGRKFIDAKYSMRHLGHKMNEPVSRGYAGTDTLQHITKWDGSDSNHSDLAIRVCPLDENGIIAMFFELIGRKKLIGYRVRYISQDAAFDFSFSYSVDKARCGEPLCLTHAHLDSLGYPLDGDNPALRGRHGQDWFTGEFKISAEDIVGEDKQPLSNLDLLVVWDYDEAAINRKGGNIHDLPDDQRSFEGATHLLRDTNGQCQVIVIKSLLLTLGISKPPAATISI